VYSQRQRDERHRSRETTLNWFSSGPVSAEGMLQPALCFLEVFCALIAIIAVLMFLIALLHTIFSVRSSNSHLASHEFAEAKQRVYYVPSTPTARRKLLQAAHLRGWLFTR
jgi:hypothetical protein